MTWSAPKPAFDRSAGQCREINLRSKKLGTLRGFLSQVRAAIVAARNLLIGGNFASLALLSRPRKMVTYVTESLFLLRSLANRRILPEKNVFDIFPQAQLADISLCNVNGMTWFHEVPSFAADIVGLCLLCRAIRPKVVFEIGTDTGYTATHMALNTPNDCRIFTLDLPRDVLPLLPTTIMDDAIAGKHIQRKRYIWEETKIAYKIHALFGDSADFDYSPYRGRVDLFFIDGAHSYEYVRSDSLNALDCCHHASVIVWHDFGRVGVNGVTRWLVNFSKQHQVYSIPGCSLAFCVIATPLNSNTNCEVALGTPVNRTAR